MTRLYNVVGMVRLRSVGDTNTGVLTVPSTMMQFLAAGTLFKPEFTDEGILYRFAGSDLDEAVVPPDWAKP